MNKSTIKLGFLKNTFLPKICTSGIQETNNLFAGKEWICMGQMEKVASTYIHYHGFPRWQGKESTCQCRRCKRHGFTISWRRKWHPNPEFLPGKMTNTFTAFQVRRAHQQLRSILCLCLPHVCWCPTAQNKKHGQAYDQQKEEWTLPMKMTARERIF